MSRKSHPRSPSVTFCAPSRRPGRGGSDARPERAQRATATRTGAPARAAALTLFYIRHLLLGFHRDRTQVFADFFRLYPTVCDRNPVLLRSNDGSSREDRILTRLSRVLTCMLQYTSPVAFSNQTSGSVSPEWAGALRRGQHIPREKNAVDGLCCGPIPGPQAFGRDRHLIPIMSLPEQSGSVPFGRSLGFLTFTEVAAMLRVSRRTLEREVERKRFPRPMKIGHASRYRQADIEEYLRRVDEDRHKEPVKPEGGAQ